MKIHANEKIYACDICEKSFRRRSDLRRHFKTHNSAESTTVQRDWYSRVFTLKVTLSQSFMDINLTPEESVPLKIATPENAEREMHPHLTCCKIFLTFFNLNQHMKIHLKEKLYICDTCQTPFGKKSDFLRRLKTHIPDE